MNESAASILHGTGCQQVSGATSSTLGPTFYIPVPHDHPPLGISQVGVSPLPLQQQRERRFECGQNGLLSSLLL